ncbi:hypothetical protein Adt_09936 [Abeliophyllum distichum]|uniref:Uncharacterized protein n=1 Tax=Abeliophyllum distichum TaxID=126358 RepID=A0ABD1UIR3_9LAMI
MPSLVVVEPIEARHFHRSYRRFAMGRGFDKGSAFMRKLRVARYCYKCELGEYCLAEAIKYMVEGNNLHFENQIRHPRGRRTIAYVTSIHRWCTRGLHDELEV